MNEIDGSSNHSNLEQRRLDLEEKKLDLDSRLRKRELDLREIEIRKSGLRSPLFLGVMAAFIGLLGNGIVVYFQGESQKALEQEKLKSNLILESIKTGDPTKSINNLEFLVKVGLLEDSRELISSYKDNIGIAPVLPASPSIEQLHFFRTPSPETRKPLSDCAQYNVDRGEEGPAVLSLVNNCESNIAICVDYARCVDDSIVLAPGEAGKMDLKSCIIRNISQC